MPRYLLETRPTTASDRERALHLAALRFPEVAVELAHPGHAEHGTPDRWMCRAPSRAHLERWAAAAHLALGAIRHIETEAVDPRERSRPNHRRVGS